MLIQATEQHFWVHFCEVVGRPDLATRGDWSISRMDVARGDMELRNELVKIFATKTQAEWTKIFIDNNIAGAPYYPLNELTETELFQARQMFVDQDCRKYGTIKTVASPVKVAGEKFELKKPVPYKGEHTDEILAEIGYASDKIANLRQTGVVGD